MADATLAPFLRWAGSKRRLLPVLAAAVPNTFGRYFEPFAGSACLFFALRPKSAVLNDFNGALIETLKTLRAHPRLVARRLHAYPRDEGTYYALRKTTPEFLTAVDQAARFIYLNRYCFNGIYRTNRENQFNVPRGRDTGELPSERHLYRCSVALRAADLRATDFVEAIADARTGDFVYLDPPYTTSSRPNYGEYGYGGFGTGDVQRLVQVLKSLDSRGVNFLLSFSPDKALLDAATEWRVVHLRVPRQVAGTARHRRMAKEVMIVNRAGA